MVEVIRVGDMLKTMALRDDNGALVPFTATVITCDRALGTGGKRIEYENAILDGGPNSKNDARSANHFENYTRNLRIEGTSQVRKFHPLLVEKFNGKTVVL